MDRAKHVTLKLQRAQEHIEQLGREVGAFYATRPYRVAHRRDPASKRLTYYVASVTAVPEHLALVAGDAIQNLMSALDHLAFQLVCADTSDRPPNPRWIYFPIADTQSDYDEKKAGKMNGASSETMSAIDALGPISERKHRTLEALPAQQRRQTSVAIDRRFPGRRHSSRPDDGAAPERDLSSGSRGCDDDHESLPHAS